MVTVLSTRHAFNAFKKIHIQEYLTKVFDSGACSKELAACVCMCLRRVCRGYLVKHHEGGGCAASDNT